MKPPVIGWSFRVRALLAVLAIGLSCPGCASWKPHAKAANMSRHFLNAAADGIDIACPEDAEADRARRCLAAMEAHDVARAAHRVYADTILLVIDGEYELSSLLPLALGLGATAREFLQAAEFFGLDLPPLPPLLTGGD